MGRTVDDVHNSNEEVDDKIPRASATNRLHDLPTADNNRPINTYVTENKQTKVRVFAWHCTDKRAKAFECVPRSF